ncbi:MAG: hypothetical protein KJ718_05465 [Nanoarchaeota archaeon]|nr:hypothetical protein [Nanoarchaeota archaeon]MBU1051971.1 hypothetical protein [Nanoarchaeota archaeon]MBU1988654.1 hypothetical protein [Nanoarchaeota archaeon]
MDLTPKETKFLTILNETRLSDGKMFGRYFEEIKGLFEFSNEELNKAVKKLVQMGLLTKIDAGGNEYVYFHTNKVTKTELDKDLIKIRH